MNECPCQLINTYQTGVPALARTHSIVGARPTLSQPPHEDTTPSTSETR